MPEYIEREAALKIVTDMMCDCKVTHKGRAIRRNIKQIPTAGVVEVVRCKDCKHWKKYPKEWNVKRLGECMEFITDTHCDDFCSWGDGKEGTKE